MVVDTLGLVLWVLVTAASVGERVPGLVGKGAKKFLNGVVERTFGWLMGCRRLLRDYELLPETSETFIYLASIRIIVRRLA